ncbi:MAG: Holliday junction branch migration protein RuvA [Candidatus Brennerbacteria bacterium]|nr:Holliday junction branch migration protein RuvA [Candidatus Brennerbacteria bacterium]
MFYSITGKLASKKENFAVVETGGIGFKVFTTTRVLEALPSVGQTTHFFCSLCVREDRLDLYGFLTEQELRFFELFNSVAGIGPKTALGLLSIDKIENIAAAISENRPDLLTRVSGVGRKTAERVILELKNKVSSLGASGIIERQETDADVEETLVNLGYQRKAARDALSKLPPEKQKLEERVKEALKILSGRK